MKEKVKQVIIKILLKILIIVAPIIVIIMIIIPGGMYIITIDDGTWDSDENSPLVYKKNMTITGDGVEVDLNAILDEALRNAGYSSEEIAKIRTDLENEGYSGTDLDDKIIERKLEKLKLDTSLNKSNITEIIWELNKELYMKYKLDDYEKLEHLINAEIVTQMPYLGTTNSTNNIDGRVYFDRYINGNTNATRLSYIEEDSFNKLIENNDSDVLEHFTITSNNEMKIAYYQKEQVSLTTNDTDADLSNYDSRVTNDNPTLENSGYETKVIPYNTMIPERYSMPFEYLWALLVVSEDYNFVKGLADLAYDSEIIISIYDNILEKTVVTEYTYDKYEINYSQINSKITEEKTEVSKESLIKLLQQGYQPTGSTSSSKDTIKENITRPKKIESQGGAQQYYVKKTIYTYINSIEMKVTYANIWLAEYTTKYNNYTTGHKYDSGIPDSTQTSTSGEDTELEKENSRQTNVEIEKNEILLSESDVQVEFKSMLDSKITTKTLKAETLKTETYIGDTWTATYSSKKDIKEDTYVYTSTYVNDPGATNTREKTNIKGELDSNGNKKGDNFCSLFRDTPKQQNITDNISWLMDILEQSQGISDMIDLTKYLLNKSTEKTYYKLDGFNFEDIFNTTNIGSLYGGSIEEQLWFALLDAGYSKIAIAGVLGNIYAESGIRSDNLQNSYEIKLGMTDDEYTEVVNNGTYTNFINDSAGYGLAQWTSAGRKEGLYLFAQSKGTNINDSSMQIEYLLGEISQSGGANGYATFQMGTDKYGYSYSSWKDATTVEDAVMAFCYVFERPKGTDHDDRKVYAKMYYDKYKDATGPSISIGNIELTGDNKEKMQALLQDAVRIANDNRYGYSQASRDAEFTYDCSSLVKRLYEKHFGITMPNTTASYSKYDSYSLGNPVDVQLKPGDVLWRRNGEEGHVVIYIGNGNYVAAHTDQVPIADQITVYQDNPSEYMKVYRFIK